MITEIVLFRLPDGMSREDAIAKYRLSIPIWQANPDPDPQSPWRQRMVGDASAGCWSFAAGTLVRDTLGT
jgi:hypothetical protein